MARVGNGSTKVGSGACRSEIPGGPGGPGFRVVPGTSWCPGRATPPPRFREESRGLGPSAFRDEPMQSNEQAIAMPRPRANPGGIQQFQQLGTVMNLVVRPLLGLPDGR